MDTNDGRREMRRVDWDFVPEAVVVGERGVSCVGFAFEDAGYSFFLRYVVTERPTVIWHRDACRIGLWGTGIR